jgi:hypothetical protein
MQQDKTSRSARKRKGSPCSRTTGLCRAIGRRQVKTSRSTKKRKGLSRGRRTDLGGWRTDTANQRGGGSEWEPIKILLEGNGNSNKMNTASNTRLRLTTQIGQAHVATGVPLDLGTNTQPSDPRTQRNNKPRVYRPTPVRLVSTTSQTGPCWWELATSTKWLHTGQASVTNRSDRFKPESPQITKQAYQPPNWPKLETAATQDNNEHTQTFTRAKTHRGLHRSDRSRAPVRPV